MHEHRLLALLWDVDGTLAETEMEGHRPAFNQAFAEAGLPWRWQSESYRRHLAVAGGKERIARFLGRMEGRGLGRDRIEALHGAKRRAYGALVEQGGIIPRPGVSRLMEAAAGAGITQGVVTTSSRAAVGALATSVLPQIHRCCSVWICGEDVLHKKPHPEAYELAINALERLGVGPASQIIRQVLVIEDSAVGLRAAHGAGLTTLITRSATSRHEPLETFHHARAVCDSLSEAHITLSWLESLLERR